MSYVALYRKFRPQTFAQIKGQDHVVRTLKNQLINNRIGHAYLFTGTRGTGKTSAAKLFAKAINCEHLIDGEPCNECAHCRAINAGSFLDVVEVDAASNNGVDDIRNIIDAVRYTPQEGKYKVFIIDEAHMITGPAFNAFLKTLEEPPAYAVFILATTEPHKLPITILSRCQRYDFRRISVEDLAGNLADIVNAEGVQADEKALSYIARIGDGSMRDSISLLDKCIAFNLGERLTYENVLDTLGTVDTELFSRLFGHIYRGDTPKALSIVDETVADGRDLTQFTTDFIWYIRNLLMVKASGSEDPDILGVSAENMAQLIKDAQGAEVQVLMRYIRSLSELLNLIKFASSKQVLLEVGIIRLSRPEMESDTQSLQDRIRMLEQTIQSGTVLQRTVSSSGPNTVPMQSSAAQPYTLASMQNNTATQTAAYVGAGQANLGGHTLNTQPDLSGTQKNAQQVPTAPEKPQTMSYSDTMPDDDEFFARIPKMTNPDAFAGLFDDDPAMSAPSEQPPMETVSYQPSAPSQQGSARPAAYQTASSGTPQTAGSDISAVWKNVISGCPSRVLSMHLKKCQARQLNDKDVRILAPSDYVKSQISNADFVKILKSTFSQYAGFEPDLQFGLIGSEAAATSSKQQFPEELLKNINFNIGTEE